MAILLSQSCGARLWHGSSWAQGFAVEFFVRQRGTGTVEGFLRTKVTWAASKGGTAKGWEFSFEDPQADPRPTSTASAPPQFTYIRVVLLPNVCATRVCLLWRQIARGCHHMHPLKAQGARLVHARWPLF